MALLNTPGKRLGVAALALAGALLALGLTDDWLVILARGCALAIGAIGLNLVTGYAGQVSLGHAFFVGVGAYTASALSGDPADGQLIGLGVRDMALWLPAAGAVAGLAGLLVAPIATRLRGLYLAIVTLGLVFLGEHVFREWTALTGGVGVGRPGPAPQLLGWRFAEGSALLTGAQQTYLVLFALLCLFALGGRNLARSDVGRAFAAVRDRDIAASIIGVDLRRTKLAAFTVSSFYAGVCGALLYVVTPYVEPGSFNLNLSVQFIAMVLIGGVATISGSIMGALFLATLLRVTQEIIPRLLPFIDTAPRRDTLLTTTQLETILYGLLIVVFLIAEPRGLYGIWVRIRNYWKGWPFSY
jgi:branched-chain amino acid transport system permease protein